MAFKLPTISKDEMAQRFQRNWMEQNPEDLCLPDGGVDDCLTNLNWLQNLNIMTKIGAPTPETPPASPVSSQDYTKGCMEKNLQGPGSKTKSNLGKPPVEDVDYKTNGKVKPPYSYATLICMAMKANKNKMTLSSIYKWIKENFMYYKNADPSWQNSIRHNLSLNKCFIKIPRNKDEPGKGGFWRLDPEYAESLVDGIFKKRRPAQRQPGGGSSKKPRKDKNAKQAPDVVSRVLETFQQDTPPNSAGSIVGNGELDMMADLKPVVSSPSQQPHHQPFTYAALTSGLCDYQNDAIMNHPDPRLHHQPPNVQLPEVLIAMQPPPHELITTDMQPNHSVVQNGDVETIYPGTIPICWNEVLDPDLELDNFYKYRPEESISTVVNTALTLNDDLFSSDGGSPDLPNELDLESACAEHLDIGNVTSSSNNNNSNNTIPQNDWWAYFPHAPLDVALTPLLSISVPFTNQSVVTTTTATNHVMNVNNNNMTVYPQNQTYPSAYTMGDRQIPLPDVANQPWAALEAAALDLVDDLGELDPVHAY